MNIREALDFMQHHPWNFYYVDPVSPGAGIVDTRLNKPYLNNDRYFGPPSTAFAERRLRLDEIGSMINMVDMPSGWYATGMYDYGLIDHMFAQVLDGHPDRYIVPRMHLDAPEDWLKANPEEVCVYAGGPETAEEISACFGTDRFDRSGDSGNPHKAISRQSFSSDKWLECACDALRRFIDHIENSRWAGQTLGYMIMFGQYGENMWWGALTHSNTMGDYGLTHRKRFFEWAVARYGSLPALRKAWNMPHLTSDTLPLPTLDERWYTTPADWRETKGLRALLLADDRRQADMNDFYSFCTVRAIERLCQVVHEACGKPAGAFYGYTQHIHCVSRGHAALEAAISSPHIDFLCGPKCYTYMLAGEPGDSQSPSQSIARRKLWVEENDMRSHHMLEKFPKDPYSPKTAEDSVTCFWREIYRALTYGFTFWWMNINGLNDDWYTDETLVAMFRQQADFYKKWSTVSRRSVAEILWVEDEDSVRHMCCRPNLTISLRARLRRELRQSGAPVDHLRLQDLLHTDLSQYKFIIFQDACVMPAETWRSISARIRPDAHVLWNYAAALLDPSFNPDNQKVVTGFRTIETPDRMRHRDVYRHVYNQGVKEITEDYPWLALQPEAGQEVLQSTPDGHVLTARIRRGKGANIFAADLTLRTPILRRLLADAGVTFLAPEHCSVLADDKLIGFFPRYDVQFTYTFNGTWRNVITGEIVSGNKLLAIREKKFEIFEKLD